MVIFGDPCQRARVIIMGGCSSSPTKLLFQFLITPSWQDRHSRTTGAAQKPSQGREPQTTVSSFLHTASAWPQGCLPGRQGVEVETPSHLLQDKPLPGIVRRAGRAAL